MLVIRKEQMEVFQGRMLEAFVIRASLVMRTDCGEAITQFSDEDLRAIVVAGIQKAKHYGIKYEDDVLAYLRYVMLHGSEFDNEPRFSAVREILDKAIDGTMKIRLINDIVESNAGEKR